MANISLNSWRMTFNINRVKQSTEYATLHCRRKARSTMRKAVKYVTTMRKAVQYVTTMHKAVKV